MCGIPWHGRGQLEMAQVNEIVRFDVLASQRSIKYAKELRTVSLAL